MAVWKGFQWGFGVALGVFVATAIAVSAFILFTGAGIGYLISNFEKPSLESSSDSSFSTSNADRLSRVSRSKQNAAKSQMNLFETCLDTYRLDVHFYPTTEQGLQALRNRPSGVTSWDGPYLPKPVPVDPWGYPYIYERLNENQFTITCYGADNNEGGIGKNVDLVFQN
jgi:general secretion pathway protein G